MICDTEETQLFKLIFAAERGDVYLIRYRLLSHFCLAGSVHLERLINYFY